MLITSQGQLGNEQLWPDLTGLSGSWKNKSKIKTMKWDSFKNVKSVFNFVKRLGAHRPLGIFSFNLINRKNSQVLESMLYHDQIKNLLIITLCTVYLLWTFRKENNKGFCVIDPLNEQHIIIIEESHNWPNIF